MVVFDIYLFIYLLWWEYEKEDENNFFLNGPNRFGYLNEWFFVRGISSLPGRQVLETRVDDRHNLFINYARNRKEK